MSKRLWKDCVTPAINQEETLKILLKHKPELDPALDDPAVKKRPDRSVPAVGIGPGRLGLHEAGHHGKNRQSDQRVFRRRPQSDVRRKYSPTNSSSDNRIQVRKVTRAAADRRRGSLQSFYRRRQGPLRRSISVSFRHSTRATSSPSSVRAAAARARCSKSFPGCCRRRRE